LKNRLRIAPSPTGKLHIGTARTALFNWLYAKKTNGEFLIRIEDTDGERSKAEFTENILEGLIWLGLNWEKEPIKQSDRVEIHKSIIKQLLDTGFAYRCFMTDEEAETLRKEQKSRGLPPKHDNRYRNLTKEKTDELISLGKSSVIRLKIEDDIEIEWEDEIRGKIKWLGKDLGGDMVLSRRAHGYKIGEPLYNLVVVVDDNFMNITHVIRGEDHISNTAKQILIYKALNYQLPIFCHTPLILNREGKKLSKRDSVTSIDDFKKMGYLPEALANYMVLLGWSLKTQDSEIQSLDNLSNMFDLKDVNKAGAKFDWEKLNWINSQYVKKMDKKYLLQFFESFWQKEQWDSPSKSWGLKLTALLQDSIIVMTDILEQSKPFFIQPEIQKDAKEFLIINKVNLSLQEISEYLIKNDKEFNENEIKELLNNIAQKNSVKKGILMKSLRVAFFGCLSGPDLLESWALLSEINEDIPRISRCLDIF